MIERKDKRMKLYKIVLSIFLVSALMSGCSHRSNEIMLIENEPLAEQEHIFLSVYGYKADAHKLTAIESILNRYMEQNPEVIVTYEGVKGIDYWNAFERRVQANGLDDVFMVDHDREIELAEQGKLADLSGLPTIEKYQDIIKEQFIREDGSAYFLPTCISAYGLYINYDLLEKHGQKVPEKWSEFMEVCQYFAGKGITPIVANNYASLRNLIVGESLYSVYQKDSAAAIEAFNHAPAELVNTLRPGIEMVEEMIDRKWIDCEEVSATNQTSDDLRLFAGGNRPFMITGNWATSRVADMEPGFSYGVHPFPILDDGSVLVIEANTCISVNAGSEHIEEVMELVECITQPDSIWEYCDSQNSYTPLKDDRVPTEQTILPASECLESGRIVIGSDYRLSLPLDNSLSEITKQMLNGMSSDKAVALLNQLLAQ
ncbi:MAG: extracellular solute-binding protein [Muricomes sp.]|uniref:ABC transporter substrate-binding protein n=1 Tax=Faecalicatena contorta TaxID=39482 RepID=UPI002EAAAB8C|nr:extracellular solute-binding protein [Muricomes sp.]